MGSYVKAREFGVHYYQCKSNYKDHNIWQTLNFEPTGNKLVFFLISEDLSLGVFVFARSVTVT